VALESTLVAQHISSIVIFVAVFVNLHNKHLGSHTLITVGTAGTAVGYIFWEWNNAMLMPKSHFQSNDSGHCNNLYRDIDRQYNVTDPRLSHGQGEASSKARHFSSWHSSD